MRLISSPVVAIALILGGCGPLSYITPDELEERYNDLDEDGDGYKAGINDDDPAGTIKDCNDDPDNGGAFETPSPEGESPEIPYDGYDNDCGKAGIYDDGPAEWVEGEAANQLPSGDVIDVDGDGYAGIDYDTYLAIAEPGTEVAWPDGVDKETVDCNDYDDFITPGKQDDPYDGIDADCGCDQDFDVDGDGYVLTEYWDEHQEFLVAMGEVDYCGAALDALATGDCDDNASTGAQSFPGQAGDVPYDGLDTDCDGANDFDQDGDGWMPDGYTTALQTYNQKYGYTLTASNTSSGVGGFDCEDDPAYPMAGTVAASAINPDATEVYNDGVDQDCSADNDFDEDADGWMQTTNSAAFGAYESYWFGDTGVWGGMGLSLTWSGYNECDDLDPLVHPQAMEYVGDAVDQDCDGDVDTTTFAIGAYKSWEEPRDVEVEYDGTNYQLVVTSSDMVSSVSKTERGALLWVDPADVGWDTDVNERIWESGTSSTTYTLGWGFDIAQHSCGSTFTATSFYENPTGYLMLRELEWTGSLYDNNNAKFKTQSLDYDPSDTTRPYPTLEDLDVDLQEDDGGDLWVLACGEERLHTFSVTVDSTCTMGTPDYYTEIYWPAGETCVLDYDTPSGNPYIIVGDEDGLVTWEVDSELGFTSPVSDPWAGVEVHDADSHDGWMVFSMVGTEGVQVHEIEGSDSYTVLSSYEVYNADAVWYDVDSDGTDELVVVAVVDDTDSDGYDDFVLAYGDPSGTMEEVEFDLGMDEDGDGLFDDEWSAESVALHVDGTYLLIGATGAGSTYDMVAWTFMGWNI